MFDVSLNQDTRTMSAPRAGDTCEAASILTALREKLSSSAWRKETSYWPDEWSDEVPSIGQCAITSLLVQDFLGGDIEEVVVEDGRVHFRNIVPTLGTVDLTEDQFPEDIGFIHSKPATRQEILTNEDTRKRYSLLRKLIQA